MIIETFCHCVMSWRVDHKMLRHRLNRPFFPMSYQKRWEGGVTLEPTGETEIRGLEHQQVGILGKVFAITIYIIYIYSRYMCGARTFSTTLASHHLGQNRPLWIASAKCSATRWRQSSTLSSDVKMLNYTWSDQTPPALLFLDGLFSYLFS